MVNRIEISDELRDYLLDPSAMPPTITVRGVQYTPDCPVGAGYKGAVWKVRDEFGRPRALKIAILDDYQDRSYLAEVQRAGQLERYEVFARIVDAGTVAIEVPGDSRRTFIGFVEEWINGNTLEAFLNESPLEATPSFMVSYVGALTSALSALEAEGLMHDDLHYGNVMIAEPPPGEIDSHYKFKVIDTGSLKPADVATSKPKDDHRNFVDHLVTIRNAIHSKGSMPTRERRFIAEADKLISVMIEEDASVRLRDPAQIKDQFEQALSRSDMPSTSSTNLLESPFEFLSAEHIADDGLLVEMFAKSCPWLAKAVSADPCLITGPRGCGKSTMFRWMSLKAHLADEVAGFEDCNLAGFYISCASDLQNRLHWIKTPEMAEKYSREIIHYFNLLLTREVVLTLNALADREAHRAYWGCGASEERAIQEFVLDRLEGDDPFRMQGVSFLRQTLEVIEREMFKSHSQMMKGLPISSTLPVTFLGDLSNLISRIMPRFQEKKITFLIDDFSTHRLSDAVQRVLNRVIWERRSSHIFKISSEKYGAELTDPSGALAELAREMVEIDCGREFLALDDRQKAKEGYSFAVELLNNRLKKAGYAGTAEGLIGSSSWPEGTLGRALANRQPGRVDYYHGLDCVASVCSGDVSALLLIYRRMFESAGVNKNTTSQISKRDQSEAIRSVSREMFMAMRGYFPKGPEMYAVVSNFGGLVRDILEKGREQKKGETTVPSECPRIEIDQPQGSVYDLLSSDQDELARELVRRAIFIDMEPGLSRHGNVPTLRWQLRRIYLPTFGASLAKNTAVKENGDWFQHFLSNPELACKLAFDKWPKKVGTSSVPHNQLPMLGNDDLDQAGD